MNQQMMQALGQIKSIKNPKNAAIQALQNASSQGNIVAQGLLKDIELGNTDSIQNTLTNFMNTQGVDINEIRRFF